MQILKTFGVGVFLVLTTISSSWALAGDFDAEIYPPRNERGKALFLTADTVKAIEIARLEFERRSVDMSRLSRFMVLFQDEIVIIEASRPNPGGLDGERYSVEIRKADLKILNFYVP